MKCALCKHPDMIEFLDLGTQPLANKYPKQQEFAREDFFPLTVFFCPACKNVQLGEMVSRERMFEEYFYLSSVNQGLVRHFEGLAEKLKEAQFVIDIGSNDGILLKPLREHGVRFLGVEPSVNVSKIANDAELDTLTSFFNAEAVEKIVKEYGRADIVVASSIFTHLEDPHTFIEDVNNVMTDDGAFIIEVEYIGNILKDVQFERFYLDRIFYYSLTSLKHLFELHGMHIADVAHITPHGGSLQVWVKKGIGESSQAVTELLKEEEERLTPEKLSAFKKTVGDAIAAFKQMLAEYKKQGLSVAGYGSPARVATITNFGQIGPELIEFIVDDSPLKQGRHSPGMHIPIVPASHLKEHKADVLVVFAHEYFDDIKKKTEGGGYRYLFPIPPREMR